MGIKSQNRDYSTAHLSKSEREQYALETARMTKEARGNASNQLSKSNYLDLPATREYHKIIRRKCLLSDRNCLNSPEEMTEEILGYFQLCDDYNAVPGVISMANYLGINKAYMYQIANGDSELATPLKKAIDLIHDIQESAALKGAINNIVYIYCSKNYFGMSDNQTITLKPDTGEAQNRADTLNALQEVVAQQNQQLLEEKTTNDYEND